MTTDNIVTQAWEEFFLRRPKRFELDEIEETRLGDEEMLIAFAVFKATLNEIIRAVQAFYNMAMAGVLDGRFHTLFLANSLRVRADFIGTNKEDDDGEIRREARKRTVEDWNLEGRDQELLEEAANRLVDLSGVAPDLIADSNNAILRQSSVMLWSATESLLREFFRVSLNRQPLLSNHLFESDEAKRYWNVRGLTIDVIQGADFDLRQCMGDILLEINSMISLKAIKAAYAVICHHNERLLAALKSRLTYNLFALRNLVAHRSGLVDAKFLSETGFAVPLGEKLNINPALFEELYMAAKTIGLSLFESAQQGAPGDAPQAARP